MEDLKYYTPEIEEFYIGFECEWQCKIREETWNKQVFDMDLISIAYDAWEHSDEEDPDGPYSEQFRVKFLDSADIESLGWKLLETKKSDFTGKNLSTYKINREVGFNTGEDYFLTELDRKNSFTMKIDSYGSWATSSHQINITIKNKSELKKLMQMLNIN